MLKKTVLIACLLMSVMGLQAQLFQDIANSIGMNTGTGHIGGISFCDFNGDGFDDLTLSTGNSAVLRFFQNNNGTLIEIGTLVPNTDNVKQLIWVDYDNDGDKDLFLGITNGFNRLYQNDGNMTMTDITIVSGMPFNMDPTYSASFGDYDNDGWVDLYIGNLSFSSGSHTNYLLKNNQDGTFSDVTTTLLGNGLKPTFQAVFFDYNNDLTPDLYIVNDKNLLNALFENNNGVFSDVSSASNTDILMDAMNIGVGDYDSDGDLDVFITNVTIGQGASNFGSVLFQNNSNGTFTNVAVSSGVEMPYQGWGGNWLDYDNDMHLDLYVSSDQLGVTTPSKLYKNIGNGTFVEPLPNGLMGDTTRSYVNAVGDFNEDGLMDILVSGTGAIPYYFWENINTTANSWVKVNLEGVQSNRDGIGAWIEVTTGADTQYRYTICGEAFLAQNSMNHHIGLGTNTIIDEIKIRWPSGIEDVLTGVAVNQKITIVEGDYPLISCPSTLNVSLVENNTTYSASQALTSGTVIPSTFLIQYEAGDCIELQADFEVELGAEFSAGIATCQ